MYKPAKTRPVRRQAVRASLKTGASKAFGFLRRTRNFLNRLTLRSTVAHFVCVMSKTWHDMIIWRLTMSMPILFDMAS